MQSSKHMAMSEPSARCTSMESSGVSAHGTAIDGRLEAHALLGDLAHGREAEHLEAARVGEDGLVPVHEAMQSAVRADDLGARPQHQVEGVAEDDLCADVQSSSSGVIAFTVP